MENTSNEDFTINNATDSDKQVRISIFTDGSDNPIHSETLEISPDEKKSYSQIITESGRYRIEVAISDQLSDSHTWWADESPNSLLYVNIEAASIEFREISS